MSRNSQEHGATLPIRVQPGARRASVRRMADGVWRIAIAAPAVDGKANEALCRYLAELLDLPVSSVTVERGQTSRQKVIAMAGVSTQQVEAVLAQAVEEK